MWKGEVTDAMSLSNEEVFSFIFDMLTVMIFFFECSNWTKKKTQKAKHRQQTSHSHNIWDSSQEHPK